MNDEMIPHTMTITETAQPDGNFQMYFFWTVDPNMDDYRVDIYSVDGKLEALATSGKQSFVVLKKIHPGYKKITLSARKNGVWTQVYSKNYVTPNWTSPIPIALIPSAPTPAPTIEKTVSSIIFQVKIIYGIAAVCIVAWYVYTKVKQNSKK